MRSRAQGQLWGLQSRGCQIGAVFHSPRKGRARLSLGSGLCFGFHAYDEESALILNHLSKTMRMTPDDLIKPDTTVQIKKGTDDAGRFPFVMRIMGSRCLHAGVIDSLPDSQEEEPSGEVVPVCIDNTVCSGDTAFYYLWQLSLPIVHSVEIHGGLLLHGALVARDGHGIILAGPSEAGKTTASARIPHPWQTLSDDCALLIKTGDGYMAHPWPTWSRFICNQGGGAWEVEKAVALRGIFFLRKSENDGIEGIELAQAACMLIESAEQASAPPDWVERIEDIRTLRTRRLDNLCSLAQRIPSFLLSVSMSGRFWELIEKSLEHACV